MNPRLEFSRAAAELAAHPALHRPASTMPVIDPARLDRARCRVSAMLDAGGQMAFDLPDPTEEAA